MINEKDIVTLIEQDEWMMNILRAAKNLNLPDWWICAGFVRSKIWDTTHGFRERTPLDDIDVVYFDSANIEESVEKQLEDKLRSQLAGIPWSVKNEARMHLVNEFPPYSSTIDAISKFPETATALGVKLNEKNEVILCAPHGVDDVIEGIIKPTPFFTKSEDRMKIFSTRITKKNWKAIWENLKISYH